MDLTAAANPAMLRADAPGPRRHPFTREEFHQLGEYDAQGNRRRIELLDGEVVDMRPMNMRHANAIRRLERWLHRAVPDPLAVSTQLPLALSALDEPEPDLYVAPLAAGIDSDHPHTALLVIEVADSSLHHDRTTKLRLYARSGVAEYWIVDVNAETVEVHTEPAGDGYATKRTHRRGQTVLCAILEGAAVAVDEVFGVSKG
ncbi:MAG: Uma2 family endonuclease [Deltaproteobacteria bacterium]|nr:Uma2 family endonuclease [Deltaproteobacteria bacterium]